MRQLFEERVFAKALQRFSNPHSFDYFLSQRLEYVLNALSAIVKRCWDLNHITRRSGCAITSRITGRPAPHSSIIGCPALAYLSIRIKNHLPRKDCAISGH